MISAANENNNASSFSKKIGSKDEVFNGIAEKTSGGLHKEDLITSSKGKIISKKRHEHGKKAFQNILQKHGKQIDNLKQDEISKENLNNEESKEIAEAIKEDIKEEKKEDDAGLKDLKVRKARSKKIQ